MKDERNDEDIVHGQAFFDQIARIIKHAVGHAVFIDDENAEDQGDDNVKGAEPERFADGWFFVLFMKNKEVEKQKNGNDDAENNPHQVGGEYHVMGKEFL